jgi:hypothetical protein
MSRKAILIISCWILAMAIGSALWWLHRSPLDSGPIDVAALGNFSLDQINGVDTDVPQSIRELGGKRVALLGEMWQAFSAPDSDVNVQGFDLTRLSRSSPSPAPKVQDFIRGMVPSNRVANYFENDVLVTGTLRVGIHRDSGRISSVFTMDVETVQPAPPRAAPADATDLTLRECFFPALTIIVVSPLLLRRLRRRHRLRNDLCLTCGYALTGNVSGICPECGNRINARSRLLGR